MDIMEILEIVIKMFEKLFIHNHKNKRIIADYKLNKDSILKDLEAKAESEIKNLENAINDLNERFKDYKSANVNTDHIVKRLSDLQDEKAKQEKKLQDIKRLK